MAEPSHHNVSRGVAWASWIFGIALLAAVIAMVAHASEARVFVGVPERANPWKSLERYRVPPDAVRSSVLVDIASYHAAYALALTGALVVLAWHGEVHAVIITSTVLFLLFSTALSGSVIVLAGKRPAQLTDRLG